MVSELFVIDKESESPSAECIIDAIKIIRTCSNIQFKGRHYIPIKGCNQGPKDACDYNDIAMDEVDKVLVDFSFNDLKLDIYGRYCDDTFIPWLHGIDNLMIFKQALDEHIRSIYPNINFAMIYDYKEIQSLDFTVHVKNGFLKTKIFFKPTDNVRSSHQEAVFRSISRTVANRVRRNCTDDSEFVRPKSEYSNYLLRAGYNISSIDNAFQNVQLLSQETLVRKTKENQVNIANTSSKQKYITSFTPIHHPVINEIPKVIRKNLRSAVDSSEQLKEI